MDKNKEEPKISIITVVFNGVKTIEQTILSVVNQTYDNIEYIIIDGGSTDGTIDIIKNYEDRIAYWVSEPDDGIYDAMNKGIEVASGIYTYFLGADDSLILLPEQELRMAQQKNIPIIFGNVRLSNGKTFISKWNWKLRYGNTVHHQALFVKSQIIKERFFDIRYKIYADFDLNQKLYRANFPTLYANVIVANYSVDGASSEIPLKERLKIIFRNYGLVSALISLFWYIYHEILKFKMKFEV